MEAEAEFQIVCDAWAAFGRDDLDGALARIHPDVVVVPFGAAMEGRRYVGHAGLREWWLGEIRANWRVFHTQPQEFREVDGKLLVYGRWLAEGRDSGVELDVQATWVVEFRDGMICYWQTFTDRDDAHGFLRLRET